MALPNRIRISGREIQVRRTEMKEGEFGEYIQHKYLINIAKSSSLQEAESTLFHEAIHAAFHISGLSELLPQTKKYDMEEALVICLENAFGHAINLDKLKLDK